MENYIYSAKELKTIASEAYRQIRVTTANSVFYSWGVSKIMYTMCNNLPALALRVNGRLLSGVVFVALNEGKDLYEVYTQEDGTNEPKLIAGDLYSDMVSDCIDKAIERGKDWNEYQKFLKLEREKVYRDIFG